MMQVYCPNPHCGATYRLPDEKVGIKFHCQKCRQVVFTDAEKRLTAPPSAKKTPTTAIAPPRPAASAAPVKIPPPTSVLKKTAAPTPAPVKKKYDKENTGRITPKLQAAVVPPPRRDDEVLYEIDGNDEMNLGADTTILPDEFIEQLHKSQVESGLVEW
ncbi:hypothetical protein FACS1894139_19330 [Planctomycetales bacterium]|nr:hypothetical protein FACS1894107_12000 [Planctomycetales bacterium]GHT00452.1 hypothetical protein FACS1894108_12520 [Planctomycetales bacterium]GHT09192.1 hypothetical protein FACS1894139_19330 [Planctomycetales bacterium]